MKPSSREATRLAMNRRPPVRRGSCRAALLVGAAFCLLPSALLEAGLPEPDNLVYGTITLDGQLVTAARTDLLVEARRTPDGPAVAAYRLGDDHRIGGFYRLKVKLEAAPPLAASDASLAGDRLHIVVRGEEGLLVQETIEVGQRGLLTRLDLDTGNANPDQDGNGLADAWELLQFGRTGNDPQADPDQDGHSTLDEFLAGTAPNDRNSVCRLDVELDGGGPMVTFLARRAQGVGYEASVRYHTLEAASGLPGPWADVPGFTGIPGDDRVIAHPIPRGTTQAFYRVRIWLQPR